MRFFPEFVRVRRPSGVATSVLREFGRVYLSDGDRHGSD
ncbi:hypothetical protein C8D88_104133 [Lentzea atacamensis]|uniref:Uncharacterized protein n=1 Tax=Lentzea atacamensis TaxID=531938 RepID=A0A316I996_9PSEU|nr:hypothetical protein C8D88_104133 [Lentzea atacamensis]